MGDFCPRKVCEKTKQKNSITIDFWITSGEYGSTLNKILVFLRTLDGHNASIKLKSTINKTSIDSSDTTTFKGPHFLYSHRLDVTVFFKPTDIHALFFKMSFHPKHTFCWTNQISIFKISQDLHPANGYQISHENSIFSTLH